MDRLPVYAERVDLDGVNRVQAVVEDVMDSVLTVQWC